MFTFIEPTENPSDIENLHFIPLFVFVADSIKLGVNNNGKFLSVLFLLGVFRL